MKTRDKAIIIVISLIAILATTAIIFSNYPNRDNYSVDLSKYSDSETEEIVIKMIAAHGGMDKWVNAPTISYTHDMIDPAHPDDHWLSKETHEQGRRRSYQEWTADQAILVNDGTNIWTVDWKRDNPPSMMSGVSYFFINMVWVTQDTAAKLERREATPVDLIEKDKLFHTVRLTFTGASPYEYFDMYIDPETYILRGAKYTVTDKDLFKAFDVPEDTKFMGPLLKVYKEFTNVNGLKMTARYDTYKPTGQNYGIHKVWNYDITQPFDESKMVRPEQANIFK